MTAPAPTDDQATEPTPEPASSVQGVGLLRRLAGSEPVRLYLYGVLVAVLAALVGYGVLTGEQLALWAAVGAAVLAVPVTEGVRSQVSSPRTVAQLRAGR